MLEFLDYFFGDIEDFISNFLRSKAVRDKKVKNGVRKFTELESIDTATKQDLKDSVASLLRDKFEADRRK
jgi:hypothetical protein